ncbi:hypothetical protein [Glaciimonas soli]|uniref:Uncharacterized protein n=1 Tax=Glaciimonas soli TaxID=2590999 RepID=A0A843YKL1_9BURK|nr:hypothetical protein [Glaciimonas soli]MQQ99489.1 hypothetical protein [Glaciimonas soli]
MSAPLKDFNDLKSLQQKLKAQEEVRLAEAAERLKQEQEATRAADVFRKSVGQVQPLTKKKS